MSIISIITVFSLFLAYGTIDRAPTPIDDRFQPIGEEAVLEEMEIPYVYIEVNIPATELTLYENGVELFRRPIAIGQGIFPTPEQFSFIRRIEWNPWWYPPDSYWARNERPTPPGPRNPLGLVKLPLSNEILFHGTNRTSSIGRPASHGCLRMLNSDATGLAWYLQSNFSDKNDPSYLDLYREQGARTFKVALDPGVPVKLVYRPVVARNGSLFLYPDYYNRLAGHRKAAIVTELVEGGVAIEFLDDRKIDDLSKNWPQRAAEVPIADLLRNAPQRDMPFAPECS